MEDGVMQSSERIETFPPREDLDASRHDKRLQAQLRREVDETRYAMPDIRCPECEPGSPLAWFWFRSPQWTWEQLCGSAGVVAFCDEHDRQVAYVASLMN